MHRNIDYLGVILQILSQKIWSFNILVIPLHRSKFYQKKIVLTKKGKEMKKKKIDFNWDCLCGIRCRVCVV